MTRTITADRVPRTGGPVQQTLTFNLDMLGGYDDNIAAGLGLGLAARGSASPDAMASGTVGTLNGALGYHKGNNRHALRLDTTGTAFAYPGYLDGVAMGGSAAIGGKTTVGRSTTLDLSQRIGSDPFFNPFAPSAGSALPAPGLGDAAPTSGLFERRSRSLRSSAAITQQWGRRDSTSASYTYGVVDFSGPESGDNTSQSASVSYGRVVTGGVRMRTDYTYGNSNFTGQDHAVVPATTHRIEGGIDLEHVVPTRRTVAWSLAAGASRLESTLPASEERVGGTQAYTTWLPTGSGSLKVSLTSAWAIEARYRRDFSLLQGITNELYATDTASVNVSGALGRRTALTVGTTYGNWRTPLASGQTSTFDVYGGQVQLLQMLTDIVGVTASYAYYHHRFSDVALLPERFPSAYDRNSVRIGISVRVPLVGGAAAQPLAGR